jgi:hypothetical protein
MLAVIPLVVSLRVMSVKDTVISGEQSGWNVAVAVRLNSAMPFRVGKSLAAVAPALLSALGCLPPLLMHSAAAESADRYSTHYLPQILEIVQPKCAHSGGARQLGRDMSFCSIAPPGAMRLLVRECYR